MALSHLSKDGAEYIRDTHFSGQRTKLCRSALLVLLIMLIISDATYRAVCGFRYSGPDEMVEIK